MKAIITSYVCPPIPFRGCDWSAHFDGEEEGFVGWGRTEAEAIEELEQELEAVLGWSMNSIEKVEWTPMSSRDNSFFELLRQRAMELAPDYPNVATVDHWEHLWAITSSLEGTEMANKDAHKVVEALRVKCGMSKEEVSDLWRDIMYEGKT